MLEQTIIRPNSGTNEKLSALGATPPSKAVPLSVILRQPELNIEDLAALQPSIMDFDEQVRREAETEAKYSGYLKRQQELVLRSKNLESTHLPENISYPEVAGLSKEVVEKLNNIRPLTLGQAGRISGVTPAALTCLEIHLKKLGVAG